MRLLVLLLFHSILVISATAGAPRSLRSRVVGTRPSRIVQAAPATLSDSNGLDDFAPGSFVEEGIDFDGSEEAVEEPEGTDEDPEFSSEGDVLSEIAFHLAADYLDRVPPERFIEAYLEPVLDKLPNGKSDAETLARETRSLFDGLWKNRDQVSYELWRRSGKKAAQWAARSGVTEHEDHLVKTVDALTDRYSLYIPPGRRNALLDGLHGVPAIGLGLGVRWNEKRRILSVTSVLKGSHADRMGFEYGDQILSVNGKPSDEDSLRKGLYSNPDERVHFFVRKPRLDRVVDRIVAPGPMVLPMLNSVMTGKETAYVRISGFGRGIRSAFHEALNALRSRGMTRLILDLRDNPGGFSDEALGVAHQLLSGNSEMPFYVDAHGSAQALETPTVDGAFSGIPIAVLLNEGSKSASELLAAILRLNARAILVGAKSFGKGIGQSFLNLGHGGVLKISMRKIVLPDGTSYHEEGLSPDFPIGTSERRAALLRINNDRNHYQQTPPRFGADLAFRAAYWILKKGRIR